MWGALKKCKITWHLFFLPPQLSKFQEIFIFTIKLGEKKKGKKSQKDARMVKGTMVVLYWGGGGGGGLPSKGGIAKTPP